MTDKPINLEDFRPKKAGLSKLRGAISEASASAAIAVAANLLAERPPSTDAAPAGSEIWLATIYANLYGDTLRFCNAWGKWLVWVDGRWCEDEMDQAANFARSTCVEAAALSDEHAARLLKRSDRNRIASNKSINSIMRQAQALPPFPTKSDEWDVDPWLLNTPGGTVDLRTGQMRPHSKADFITKVTAATPGGECPIWHRFLGEITGGDTELQGFLQRMVGYALTGSVRDHALFFLYGTGANGKSVLLNTVSHIWADYQRTASMETFIDSHGDRHPTDLAGLRGARLVTSVETEKGRKWAEAKIKMLTGGDPISARFMRQDFFEYTPQFKLVIAGNHKPKLGSVDEAIRRRFHLVPFLVTIPPDKRDPDLTEKLKAEWPGILQWAVEGCLEWQRIGLAPPKAVTTAAYLLSEDVVFRWFEERCERNPEAWTAGSSLYGSLKLWADDAGEAEAVRKMSQKDFYGELDRLGGLSRVKRGVNGHKGVSIKPIYGSPE